MAKQQRFHLTDSPEDERAILSVTSDYLEISDLEDFDVACHKLVATARPTMVVDISAIENLHSGFIGVILYTHVDASERGHRLIAVAGRKTRELIGRMTREMVETCAAEPE